jgi:hypothetical protein
MATSNTPDHEQALRGTFTVMRPRGAAGANRRKVRARDRSLMASLSGLLSREQLQGAICIKRIRN